MNNLNVRAPKCDGCLWLEKFDKRLPHDLSDYGCRHRNWAGYVDPAWPACGGLAFSPSVPTDAGQEP